MRDQEDWRFRAACRYADPELFFPEGTAGPAVEAADLAKRFCGRCLVRARCLDWALDHNAAFGIWGGVTEGERRDLRHAFPARVTGKEVSVPDHTRAASVAVRRRLGGGCAADGEPSQGPAMPSDRGRTDSNS